MILVQVDKPPTVLLNASDFRWNLRWEGMGSEWYTLRELLSLIFFLMIILKNSRTYEYLLF